MSNDQAREKTMDNRQRSFFNVRMGVAGDIPWPVVTYEKAGLSETFNMRWYEMPRYCLRILQKVPEYFLGDLYRPFLLLKPIARVTGLWNGVNL